MTEDNREDRQFPPTGAPRASRAAKVWWWALYSGPGLFLMAVGVWNLAIGSGPLSLAVVFAGLTAALGAINARNLYRVGYHTGALQTILDRLGGVGVAESAARPKPHPADPSPSPKHPGEVAR